MIPEKFYTEMINKGIDLTNNLMSNADSQKFVNAVNGFSGNDPAYTELSAQEEIIKNSAELTDLEKLEQLRAITAQKSALRDKELECQQIRATIVDNHIQKVGEVAIKAGLALLTAGWSLAPDIYSEIKSWTHKYKRKSVIDNTLID